LVNLRVGLETTDPSLSEFISDTTFGKLKTFNNELFEESFKVGFRRERAFKVFLVV
jgi:hypothetical protein